MCVLTVETWRSALSQKFNTLAFFFFGKFTDHSQLLANSSLFCWLRQKCYWMGNTKFQTLLYSHWQSLCWRWLRIVYYGVKWSQLVRSLKDVWGDLWAVSLVLSRKAGIPSKGQHNFTVFKLFSHVIRTVMLSVQGVLLWISSSIFLFCFYMMIKLRVFCMICKCSAIEFHCFLRLLSPKGKA